MILQVQHETRFEYNGPVSEWLAEVRMEPVSDRRQCCHYFHLAVSQTAPLFRYLDGFGNRVHHFNLLAPREHVHILAASIVETDQSIPDLSTTKGTYPLHLDNVNPQLLGYLQFGGPVTRSPLLNPILDVLRPSSDCSLGVLVPRVCQYVHDHFEYARAITHVTSPIDEVLSHGKGVCQDFAHLMIAVLRSLGVPARYVSGYLHRANKESQSHAWCEAWLPDLGWVGMDPTNNCYADEHFVRIAAGRDFTDVTPNKGIYRGKGKETMKARVETRQLDRVPSLSWREDLPPLDVPLTVLASRRHILQMFEDQQQQQQQQ